MVNRTRIIFVSIFIVLFGSIGAFAATRNVAVVFSEVTGVNREAYHFLQTEAAKAGGDFSFTSVRAGNSVNPADYDALLVFNTGISSGVDPVLEDFIAAWPDKTKLILLSFQKGSRDFTVHYQKAADNSLGVDAITAASKWQGGLGGLFGKSPVREMHDEWLNKVISIINSMN